MTTPEDKILRAKFVMAAAVMSLGKLIERGEIAGNVVIDRVGVDAAEAYFDRCMMAGMPKVTSDELRTALECIRLKGGVMDVTPLGEAASAFDRMTQGAGEG